MEELEKLYNVLKRDGYYTKSFEEFQVQSEDLDYQQKLYDVVSRDGLYTNSKEEFESKYFLKKKEPSQPIVEEEVMVSDTTEVEQPGSSDVSDPNVQPEVVEEEVFEPTPVTGDSQDDVEVNTITEVPNRFGADNIDYSDVDYSTVDYSQTGESNIDRGENLTAIERQFGKNELTDFIGDLYRAGAQGQAQGGTVDESLELLMKGGNASENDVYDFIKAYEAMQNAGVSDEMNDFNRIYQAEGGSVWGFIKGVSANKTVVPQLFVSSVSAMLNPSVLAAGTAGAAAGSVIPVVGTIGGAMFAAGTTLETALTFGELLEEALDGKPMTNENVRAVLESPDKMRSIRARAMGRGLAIGAIDGLTGGVASKVGASTIKATSKIGKTTSKLSGLATVTGIEAVGGSTGEVAGRLVAGQEMDVAEVLFEGVAGTATTPLTFGSALLKAARKPASYQVNKGPATRADIIELLESNDANAIENAEINIENDADLNKQVVAAKKKIMDNKVVKRDLESAGVTDQNSIDEMTSLEEEAATLKGNNTRAGKRRLAEINSRIDEILDTPTVETQDISEVETIEAEVIDELATQDSDSVKRETYETTDANGDRVIVQVTTAKDGSRTVRYKDAEGTTYQTETFAKDNDITNEKIVELNVAEEGATITNTETIEGFENIANKNAVEKRKQELKTKQDAVQESSTAQVDVQESTQDSSQMGERDSGQTTIESQDVTETSPEATTQEKVTEVNETVSIVEEQQPDSYYKSERFSKENPNTTPEKHKSKIVDRANKARKSINKLLPGVKIILHKNQESYGKFVKTASRGAYDPNTNTIHINVPKATGKTVAHEVFHAVLKNKLGAEVNLQKASKIMVKALRKAIAKSNNLTADQIAEFETYTKNFEGTEFQNEESLAEFIGILADNYTSLDVPQKNIVQKFINAVAKIVGIDVNELTQSEQDVVDLLNTISGKVTEGVEITESDVSILEQGEGGEIGVLKTEALIGNDAPKSSSDTREFANLIEDKPLSDFDDQSFVTNMYDFTTAGIVDLGNGITIQLEGGKSYVPLMMNRRGLKKGDVSNLAAFNTKEQAESFIRNSQEGNAKLFMPHSGTLEGSWQFQQSIFEQLIKAILDNKIVPNKELISSLSKGLVNKNGKDIKEWRIFKENYKKATGKDINSLDSFVKDPLQLVKLLDIENNYSPDLRKRFNSLVISIKKFKDATGVTSKLNFAEKIIDPLNKGVESFDLMSVVEFDNNNFEIRKPEKGDVDYHPSFAWTILAPIKGIYQPTKFYKSYDTTEKYTKYNKDGASESTRDTALEREYDLALKGKKINDKGKVVKRSEKDTGGVFFEGTYPAFQENKFRKSNVTSSAGSIPKVASLDRGIKTEAFTEDQQYEAVGLTNEEVDTWKSENKKGIKMPHPQEAVDAAKSYANGNISLDEYNAIIKDVMPITPYKEVPKVPTIKEIVLSLRKNKLKKGIVGLNLNIPDGTLIESRLDIPAYTDFGVYVDTLHNGEKQEIFGVKPKAAVGYSQVAVLNSVSFDSNPKMALKVAQGEQAKSPFAVMKGEYQNESTKSVTDRAKEAINSKDWVQVGFNPYRHAYFYDKSNSKPVESAGQVIQVGPLVLAKDIKYGKPLEYVEKDGSPMKFEKITDDTSNDVLLESIQDPKTESFKEIKGYERMMDEVGKIISKSKKRGVKFKKIPNNVMEYVMGTKVYERATDIQREAIVRDIRKSFGIKEKSAPSLKRLFGETREVKKVTFTEKQLYIKRLKELNEGAKTAKASFMKASKELAEAVGDMVAGGRISTKQAAAIIKRFSKVNMFNEASIERFVDYTAKVFNNAEYAEQIAFARKKLKQAKKNIRTKLGIATDLIGPLERLFNINPTLIPDSVFNKYLSLVEMFGERAAVLTLEEKQSTLKDVQDVLDKMYEEQSQAEEMALILADSNNKVYNEDGTLNYADTIKSMLEEGEIQEESAAIMRKYKKDILPQVDTEAKTDEELQQEKDEIIEQFDNITMDRSNLPSKDERSLARRLNKLIDTVALEDLVTTQLNNLLKVVDNINNGYLPHYAQLLVEQMDSINSSIKLANAISKGKPLPFSKIYAKLKSLITKKDSYLEMVRRNPLYNIDQVFGSFNGKEIFDSLFSKVAEGYTAFKTDYNKVQKRIEKAQTDVNKSFKLDPKKVLESSFKQMAYMIQLEFQSNPDSKQVNPASEYIKKTVKAIRDGKSNLYTENDAQVLEKILKDFSDKDGNISLDKLDNSFNKAEKNSIKTVREINESLLPVAEYTSAIIRGDKINPLTNYVHLNVMNEAQPLDVTADVVRSFGESLNPSTKAKSLIERTGKVSPINFNIYSSAQRGSKMVLMDRHLTEPVRTARRTLNRTESVLEEQNGGSIPKQERKIFNAIKAAFTEATDNVLNNTFTESSFADEVVNYISKQGYRAVLAGTGRFTGELASNVGYAVIVNPKAFSTGISNRGFVMSAEAPSVMQNVGSKQTGRIFPGDTLSGKMIDTNVLNQSLGTENGRTRGIIANKIQQIYNLTGKKYVNFVELTADALISTPDKLIMRPIWFGEFANVFKAETGVEVDFDKIANNDEAYMTKYSEAIQKAKEAADDTSVKTGATDNPFMDILKGKSRPNQTAMLKAFNNFNSFMTRFLIFEFVTARTGIYAAMGNGTITKKQGIATLAGVTTRMVTYTLLTQMLGSGLIGLLFGMDDEEEEKSIDKKIGQAFASAFTSLILGRDFGNAVKSIINQGVEVFNEEYLDFLREGEYDPYKDSIQYTIVPKKSKEDFRGTAIGDVLLRLSGSFGPALKTADLIVKKATEPVKKTPAARKRQVDEINQRIPLEVFGHLGLIPLYKDIRKVVMQKLYKDLRNKKPTPSKRSNEDGVNYNQEIEY